MVLETIIERIVHRTTTRTKGEQQKKQRSSRDDKEDEEEESGGLLDPECLPTRFKHTCNGDVELQLRKYERHLMFKRELKVETLMPSVPELRVDQSELRPRVPRGDEAWPRGAVRETVGMAKPGRRDESERV